MNKIQKLRNTKKNENGDISYTTTGNVLNDIIFLTAYLEKNIDKVKIGTSQKEKILSMYVRDPRYGLGRRDLGRELMLQSGVSAEDVILAGRFDDLLYIANDDCLGALLHFARTNNQLAKKWLPRLGGKDNKIALALCDMWKMTKKEYRKFIKTTETTEYKLSYAEEDLDKTPLNDLFKEHTYKHPLVDEIDFEKVPSLAMAKYLHAFSTRQDLKDRFNEYMQKVKEEKAKINVSTTNVTDAKKVVSGDWCSQSCEENKDILGKKIVDNATLGVDVDAIVILDTSGSMGWQGNPNSLLSKAMSIAHAISTHSSYARNQLISFSSRPQLMTIKGETLKQQYNSMYTGDCSNTDFGKVMDLLKELKKYPKYLIVLSDMEFDIGSSTSKEKAMKLFKENGANTKIVWWNLNDRNKTVPEFDEYGNIYLSGYNIKMLNLLETEFDMTQYVDKILKDYAEKIGKILD